MTVYKVQDAIESVIDVITQDIAALKFAPDYAPGDLNTFPALVVYADSGAWSKESDWKQGLHTIIVEVHFPRKNLPDDLKKVMPYIDSVPEALFGNVTLNGRVSTISEISYDVGPLGYGSQDTIGVRFTLPNIKMQSAVS
jgi:hypothetical protein